MNFDREYSRIKSINKTLSKDTQHKKLTGVCAGIAKYYDYPRLAVRLGALGTFILFPVPAGVAYVVASILLPNSQ
jgi:phage shock protein PspC (stress-responsive transcriptional regulator)